MRTKITSWHAPVIRHGKPTKYSWIVGYPDKMQLGYGSDIGAFTYLNARYGFEIGEAVQIGSHCALYSHSTIDNKKGRIVLGKKCRVGSHSVIMPGVCIGPNTVVGAMSFVNRNLPANVIAFGCPVRIVKKLKKS